MRRGNETPNRWHSLAMHNIRLLRMDRRGELYPGFSDLGRKSAIERVRNYRACAQKFRRQIAEINVNLASAPFTAGTA